MGWSVAAGHTDDAEGVLVHLTVKEDGVAAATYATHAATHEAASAANIRKMRETIPARAYFPR